MGGSGYRPSRDAVAVLYGAVRRSSNCRPCPRYISGPYGYGDLFVRFDQRRMAQDNSVPLGIDTIHQRYSRLAGDRLTVR